MWRGRHPPSPPTSGLCVMGVGSYKGRIACFAPLPWGKGRNPLRPLFRHCILHVFIPQHPACCAPPSTTTSRRRRRRALRGGPPEALTEHPPELPPRSRGGRRPSRRPLHPRLAVANRRWGCRGHAAQPRGWAGPCSLVAPPHHPPRAGSCTPQPPEAGLPRPREHRSRRGATTTRHAAGVDRPRMAGGAARRRQPLGSVGGLSPPLRPPPSLHPRQRTHAPSRGQQRSLCVLVTHPTRRDSPRREGFGCCRNIPRPLRCNAGGANAQGERGGGGWGGARQRDDFLLYAHLLLSVSLGVGTVARRPTE